MRRNALWTDRICAALAALIPLGVYLRTLLPTAGGFGDTTKFQFVGKILGLPHPTGFPVYLWLTHLASYLPVGSLAYRANLVSALCAAATIFFLFELFRHLGVLPFVALGASLVFALTPSFWSVSLIAEVYTLNTLFMTAVILLLWKWREGGGGRQMDCACVLYFLSYGNHPITLILLPAAVYLVICARDKFRKEDRYAARAALCLAAGILPYLWYFLRSGQGVVYIEGVTGSLRELIIFVSGSTFSHHRFPLTLKEVILKGIPIYGSLLRSQLGLPFLFISMAGLVRLWVRDRVKVIFLLIVCAGDWFVSVNGTSLEMPLYYIPSYLALSIFFGCAFLPVRGFHGSLAGKAAHCLASALLCVYALYLFILHLPLVDLREKLFYNDFSEKALHEVRDNSVILSPNYNWTQAYLYKLLGEGARGGDNVFVLHHWEPPLIGDYLEGRSIRPVLYRPSGEPGGRMSVYYHTLSMNDPGVRAMAAGGFRLRPVLEHLSPLARSFRETPPEQIVLLSLRDEAISILNDDSFDALRTLGLKTVVARGGLFGWGYGAILAARDGKLTGLQQNIYGPVRLHVKKGETIRGTGISAPVDLLVESRGVGRGDISRISVGKREVALGRHGLNFVFVDARSGKVVRAGNIPPARLDEFRESFLLEITDGGKPSERTAP